MRWWPKKKQESDYTINLTTEQFDALVATLGIGPQFIDDMDVIDGMIKLFVHLMNEAGIDPEWAMRQTSGVGYTCRESWLALGKSRISGKHPELLNFFKMK